MENSVLFHNFFQPYHERLEENINENTCLNDTALASVHSNLYEELFSLSHLSLIHELNHFRDQELLKGVTTEERFSSFEEIIGTSDFKEYIEKKYPTLVLLMNNKLSHIIESVNKIIQVFLRDKQSLEQNFGKYYDQISDVQIGAGDVHEQGKTVAILSGNFGKLVYKPNTLLNDVLLNELIDLVNQDVLFKLKKVKIISRDGYAWQEYVEHQECKSSEEVHSYYHRLGTYLSLFYLLNASDYHNENIIACGEYPIIIDTETLITTSVNSFDWDSTLYNLLQDNVLRSGLLPVKMEDSYLDMDISGLSGGDIESSSFEIYEIEEIGTDRMKVRKKFLKGEVDKSHIPYVDNSPVNVLDYIDNFTEGFKEGMRVLMKKKESLKKLVKNNNFKEATYRQVLRPTYVYAKVLEASTYPTYLMDFKDRLGLLNRVINNEPSEKSFDEVKLLSEGYIPAYECLYDSMDLYRNKQLVEKEYFAETPMSVVERKIDSLSEETIRFQVRLLECSILTILKEPTIPDEDIILTKNKYNNIDDSLKNIYDELLLYEITLPNKKLKDIFQVRACDGKYFLGGSNFSLYEGGGMIWSIYCYGLAINDEYIQRTAICLLQKAEINYSKSKIKAECSAFSETFGAVYLYYNFYKSTGNMDFYDKYKSYLEQGKKNIEFCTEWDYITGISGVIHLLSNLYKEQQDVSLKEALILSKSKLEELLTNDFEEGEGLAHGRAGAALAYADIFELTKEKKYLDKVLNLLEAEDGAIEKIENKSWCNGLGGIIVASAEILNKNVLSDEQYKSIFNKFHEYFEKFINISSSNNICLCHGSSGELEILNELLESYSDLLFEKEVEKIQQRIVIMTRNIPDTTGNNLGVPLGLPLNTFMLGSSGVAYAQLRVKNSTYPSILMLNTLGHSLAIKERKLKVSIA